MQIRMDDFFVSSIQTIVSGFVMEVSEYFWVSRCNAWIKYISSMEGGSIDKACLEAICFLIFCSVVNFWNGC